jgi:transposase
MSNSTKKSPSSRTKTAKAISSERKPALSIIKDIQRQSRRQYTAEEKIRIVLEGLQGEQSVAEICRREGLNRTGGPNQYLLPLELSILV